MDLIDTTTGEILQEVRAEPPFLRSAYNYNRDLVSLLTGLECQDPSRAQQQFAEESDINVIVQRFGLTGQLPQNVRMPTYGDFTGITDFQTAANAIRAAEEAFMAMPADVRTEFGNDPARFVDFCSDETNRARAEKLGLLDPAVALERARKAQAASTATGQGVPPAPAPGPSPAPTPSA